MEVWCLTSWEGSTKNWVCPSTHFCLGWYMDMADRSSAAILDHEVANTCWEWRSSKSRGIWSFWNPSICLPWTSIMRKRNVVLSCLTYCPGFFVDTQPMLILPAHSENSFLNECQNATPEELLLCRLQSCLQCVPLHSQPSFSSSFPLILWASHTISLNSLCAQVTQNRFLLLAKNLN